MYAIRSYYVLDDAVVDQGDAAGLVDVRMRIDVVRDAMRRPAGMPDADRRYEGMHFRQRFEIRDLARALEDFHRTVGEHRHSGRIIPAIFQTFQSVYNNRRDFPEADVVV